MKALIKKVSGVGATVLGTLAALPVLAATQTDYLGEVVAPSGLTNQPLTTVLGNLISVVLSVLGVVLLVLVIYAGILWMTAGGDSGKVDKAKALITNAVIGLVLILAALAISTFVFDTLTQAVAA